MVAMTARRTGIPMMSVLDEYLSGMFEVLDVEPTMIVYRRWPSVGWTSTRNGSSSIAETSVVNVDSVRSFDSAGSSSMFSLDATTVVPSMIWTRPSSSLWTATDSGEAPPSIRLSMSMARCSRELSTASSCERCRVATKAAPAISSATNTTSEAPMVVRTCTDWMWMLTVEWRPVDTLIANGLNRRHVERLIDLAAEVPDVDLDDVGVAVEGVVPHVVEDLALRDDRAGVRDQVLEDGELAGGELDLDGPRASTGERGVEAQRSPAEDSTGRFRRPAHERPQPGHQHHDARTAWTGSRRRRCRGPRPRRTRRPWR